MQNLKELSHLKLTKISGGGVTPPKGAFFNPDGKTNPYDIALGGTTYPHQGACPIDSDTLGYIGGGQNLCRKR